MKQDFRFGNRTLLENPWNWLRRYQLAVGDSAVFLAYGAGLQPHIPCATPSWLRAMGKSSRTRLLYLYHGVCYAAVFFDCHLYGAWRSRYLLDLLQPDRPCPDDCAQHIYNPVKIRAQAEAEYEERRRKKAEDKKRLAESRAREQEEARRGQGRRRRLRRRHAGRLLRKAGSRFPESQ